MSAADFIAHDAECSRPGHPEKACSCGADAFRSRVEKSLELVGAVSRLDHEEELEDGMSADDAVDTVNSLVSWARSIVAGATTVPGTLLK